MQLLERDNTLLELKGILNHAVAGQGRLVLVSGEAGIGKTSVIARFTSTHGTAARVLWGACDALFTPRPLGPFHDIAAETEGTLRALLKAETSRTELFSVFLSELQQPSIVVFDDVHSGGRGYARRT